MKNNAAVGIGVRILRAREQLYADLARVLKPFGVTEPQYNVLRILRGAGREGLPSLEIGRRMITRIPDITRLLDRLEKEKLVARQRDRQDRRIVVARLTAGGEKLLKKADKEVQDLHGRHIAGLGDREQAQLARLLDKLITSTD